VPDVIDLRRGTKSQQVATIAMGLFLFSWGVTFVALLMAYAIVRSRQPVWPPVDAPVLPLGLPLANTFVAVASSVAFHKALAEIRRGRQRPFQRWIAGAGGLGVVFLALQGVSWADLWGAGLRPGESVYAGMFYMMTSFHAAHVLAGVLLLVLATPAILRGRYTARDHLPVRLTTWFWHFVTGAWLTVLVAVYLL
jgi:heme/copper-type cytochrome/quinol oxidase subunit 3